MDYQKPSLYLKDSFLSPVEFLISTYIYEYDISKANISILYSKGVLSEKEYRELYVADRFYRQYTVGNMQKDKRVATALSEGLKEYRKLFMEENGLQDIDILSVKKDAIFLINKVPTVTKFGLIEFVMKGRYTSYYRLPGIPVIEAYYNYDSISGTEVLDIKGIDDSMLPRHEAYMLEFLKVLFESAQSSSIEETLGMLVMFYQNYLNRELDVGYYREFNPLSLFRVIPTRFNSFMAEYVDESSRSYLDISCNRDILICLYRYYSSILLSHKSQRHIKTR